jgi:O-acetyl-ADP-ribose deacetylase (regulator of RNase III)
VSDVDNTTGIIERIHIFQGDITKLEVDTIVNAASSTLLGGGGVDEAIHEAAGEQLLEECRGLNGCSPGDAKITKGYLLPAKYVIHTVGPVYQGGDKGEAEILYSCYSNSLSLAVEMQTKTIAFPCISTGNRGYPFQDACKIALNAAFDFLQPVQNLKVFFVCHNDNDYKQFYDILSFRINFR